MVEYARVVEAVPRAELAMRQAETETSTLVLVKKEQIQMTGGERAKARIASVIDSLDSARSYYGPGTLPRE